MLAVRAPRLLAPLLALSLAVAPLAQAQNVGLMFSAGGYAHQVDDQFQRANAAFTTPWTVVPGFPANFEVSSDTAIVSSLSSDVAYYYAGTFSSNQWCAITFGGTLGTNPTNGYGCAVRASTSAKTMYWGVCNGNGYLLARLIAGANTQLLIGNGTTCAAHDTFEVTAAGTTICILKNWKPITTCATDSAISSGQPAIYYSSTENVATAFVANFTAGAIQ
jgi:hypothetical protein